MASGNVEIKLPDKEQVSICCSKVGYMENGEFLLESSYLQSGVNLNMLRTARQLEEAAKRLETYAESGFLVESDSEGIAKIEDLEEGVYLINSFENQDGEVMLPTLLFLPTWDELEEKMLYDITIVPKYGVKQDTPLTGDAMKSAGWVMIFVISAIVFAYKTRKMKKKGDCF